MWYVGGVDRVENEARSFWEIVGIGDSEEYSRSLVLAFCAAEPLTIVAPLPRNAPAARPPAIRRSSLVAAADPKGAVARSTISDLLPKGPHKAL